MTSTIARRTAHTAEAAESGSVPATGALSVDPEEKRRVLQLWIVIILAFVFATGEPVVNLIVGGRLPAGYGSTGRVAVTSLGTATGILGEIAFYLGSAVIVFGSLLRRDRKPAPGAPALLLLGFFLLIVFMSFFSSDATNVRIGSRIAIVLVLVIWCIQPRIRDLRVIGAVGTLVALGSFALIPSGKAWMLQADFALIEKSLIGDQLLGGLFPQSNILGIVMATCAPFAFLMKRKSIGAIAFLLMSLALVLTSSRTALISYAIALPVALIALIWRNRTFKNVLHASAAIAIVVVVVALPLVIQDWHAFSNRGAIWMLSRHEWSSLGNFLLGSSLEFYGLDSNFARQNGSPTYHGHNQFVTLLTMSGALVVCYFVVVMIVAFRGAMSATVGSRPALMALLALMGMYIAETPLRIDTVDTLAWATWFSLICIVIAGANDRADATALQKAAPIETSSTPDRRESLPTGRGSWRTSSSTARRAP
ncbi:MULTISPECIES: hypothetical protein [Bacteria]|uniref:O-antigen ligase family protein n=1 Tax=Bacteria TaxID=2 RepID=UPI0018CCD752